MDWQFSYSGKNCPEWVITSLTGLLNGIQLADPDPASLAQGASHQVKAFVSLPKANGKLMNIGTKRPLRGLMQLRETERVSFIRHFISI